MRAGMWSKNNAWKPFEWRIDEQFLFKGVQTRMPSFLSRGSESCAIYAHTVVGNDLDTGGYLLITSTVM